MIQDREKHPIRRNLMDLALRPDLGYRLFLRIRYGAREPSEWPRAPWANSVLKSRKEWIEALNQVKELGLPPHPDDPKNWDSLASLAHILERTDRGAQILDAGTELYSSILPSLYLYGYRRLIGIGFGIREPLRRGAIRYEYGDVTRTRFEANTFDAITCLSVIEHGVDVRAYFREMSRILRRNGVLLTSTDYWTHPIDTRGQMAYAVPIRIFSKGDIVETLDIAEEYGLKVEGEVDLESREKAVRWEEYSLEYTFLMFALQKE